MISTSLFTVVTSLPDSDAITEAIDAIGQQGYLFANAISTIGTFECLMYRTEANTQAFEDANTQHEMYNYEVGKVENRLESIKAYLSAMGAKDWKIATSWIEGNFIAFVMYKTI